MTFIGKDGLQRRVDKKLYAGYRSSDGRWDVSGRIYKDHGDFFIDYNGQAIPIKDGGLLQDRFSEYTVML